MPIRLSSATWSLAPPSFYLSFDIKPDAIIKFYKIILVDAGWMFDSMTARFIRNFPVAFRAFFLLCVSIFIYSISRSILIVLVNDRPKQICSVLQCTLLIECKLRRTLLNNCLRNGFSEDKVHLLIGPISGRRQRDVRYATIFFAPCQCYFFRSPTARNPATLSLLGL